MSDRPDISPDDSGLAAEYVLGLLSEAEARAFRDRLEAEPALRAEVLGWERRFAAMAEAEVEPVAPSSGVEAQLMGRLFREEPERRGAGLWRWLAGLAVAALAAIAVLVYTGAPDRGMNPDFAARIAAEDETLVLAAALDMETGRLAVLREAGDVAEGRAQELWLIAGEAAPVSLGLLSTDAETEIVVPADLRPLFAGAVLAVSDEPPTGSPTGAPTGDVLATGTVSEV